MLSSLRASLSAPQIHVWGTILSVQEQSVHIGGLSHFASLGQIIDITLSDGLHVQGEIIALTSTVITAILFEKPYDICVGMRATLLGAAKINPCEDWTGHILNYEGRPFDNRPVEQGKDAHGLTGRPPVAVKRKPMGERLKTRLAVIDSFLPLCQGQRVGLFAGSGVGKSTLLGMLARQSSADINIIALIGERGREVRHFADETLGTEGMKKSIIFAATSDMPSALKLRTANAAMTTAEYFRDQGKQVLFLCDSLTRYAEAHRDKALCAGEVPSLRAYPPSTFQALAGYCERSGPGEIGKGDITAIYSVLVAGSDMEEPIADMVRGILDGHIILSRDIAERGRYPAIDVPRSISRALPGCATDEENILIRRARAHLGRYEESQTLIKTGLYVSGTDTELDEAIRLYPALEGFIQNTDSQAPFEDLQRALGIETDDSLQGGDEVGDAAATEPAA